MDTKQEFDYDYAVSVLAEKSRKKEWEQYVSRYQKTSASASAKEK